MPLPLLWIGGAIIGAGLIADEKQKRKQTERDRLLGLAPKEPEADKHLGLGPSLIDRSLRQVAPKPGAIVCCYVYGMIEHTGIWLGDNMLIELHGSGLVRVVSVKRFLAGRTGTQIYLACDHQHQPLINPLVLSRAESKVYQYREYDLFDNNCHRFVYACLTDIEVSLPSFNQFNAKLAEHFGEVIYWDEMKHDDFRLDFVSAT